MRVFIPTRVQVKGPRLRCTRTWGWGGGCERCPAGGEESVNITQTHPACSHQDGLYWEHPTSHNYKRRHVHGRGHPFWMPPHGESPLPKARAHPFPENYRRPHRWTTPSPGSNWKYIKGKMEKQETKRVDTIKLFFDLGERGTGNTKDTRIRRNAWLSGKAL